MQDSRKKVSMQTIIGEVCGAVSLCWNPKPTGVFDSEQATKFVNEAIAEAQAGIEQYVLSEKQTVLRQLEHNLMEVGHEEAYSQIESMIGTLEQLKALQAKEANDESS